MNNPAPASSRACAAVLAIALASPLGAQGIPNGGAHRLSIERIATVPPAEIHPSSRRDVTVTAGGTTFLLDSRSDRVYAFSRSGKVRTTLVLTPPKAAAHVAGWLLAPFGDDGLLVYDAFGGRVHAYRWATPSSLVEVANIPVGAAAAKDLCAIGDTIFLLAYDGDHMIHAYGLRGGRVRSFGDAPGSNRFARAAIINAGGHLACSSGANAVVVGFAASGIVEAYRTDGAALWQFAVPGFSGLDIRTMPDSSVHMSWKGATRDAVVSVLLIAPGSIAIQVRQLTAAEPGLETTLVSLTDGHALGVQRDIPMMRQAAGTLMISTEGVAPLHADLYTMPRQRGGH